MNDLLGAILSLVGAVIGAVAAIAAAGWSMHRAVRASRAESRGAERSSLEALLLEIDVVEEIARAASATPLPTQMLTLALPGVHHMAPEAKKAVIDYAAAVHRYDGRVQRIVAFGAAKRAGGKAPGVEKVGATHTGPVLTKVEAFRSAIRTQLDSPRLKISDGRPGRWRWARRVVGGRRLVA